MRPTSSRKLAEGSRIVSSESISQRPVASGKREQNAARNRAAILLAAREAFCEIGFGATTVRDIIRRTDLASGTFYNYFPDKDALLHELIQDFQIELRRRVHEAREAADTLEDLLRSAFRACFEIFVEDEVILALVMRNAGEIEELTSVKALDPAAADLANDLRAKAREGVVPEMDFDLIALAAVAVGSELAFRAVRTGADVEKATEFATDLFLGGIERMGRKT
ncbi:MAG: TetR/AcrR family transcriptional regulator [Deltaproteobacteria bacterium]|nr:TetR/AcrR family transcriptional regulator [Deltaproteobacteria bacterium]MBW2384610.1 TetR/AcrR family transcriptional regulator [Deltaproteobacteria bacterium]MBW2696776.1 TetR/AcrR family transcriptional regulator [Deltaproteobacteria bacterium]